MGARVAWLLWTATLVIAAVGLALLVWDWSARGGLFGIRGFDGVVAVCFGGVGALLAWRHPGHLVRCDLRPRPDW